MEFKFVKVYPAYPRIIYITWELSGIVRSPVNFSIYRSESEYGEFTKLNDIPIINRFFYEDYTAFPLSKLFEANYKVIARDSNDRIVESQPINLLHRPEKEQFILAREEQRRLYLKFRKFSGIEVFILKKRNWGDECNTCRNLVTGETLSSSCVDCWGTGFIGGYYTPILTYVEIGPTPVVQDKTEQMGGVEPIQSTILMIARPLLSVSDIIIEKNVNKRWNVRSVELTERRHFPITQQVRVNEIEHKDVIYDFSLEEYEELDHSIYKPGSLKI